MKKIILVRMVSTILFCSVLLIDSSFAFSESKQQIFSDLGVSHWAYENIVMMIEEDILSGYPDGTFRPEAAVTYGEFIKMAGKAIGIGSHPSKAGEHWALGYYKAGLNNFMFSEFDIQERMLDKPIRRNHMALIASSALKQVKEYGDHSVLMGKIGDVDYRTPYEFEIVKSYGLGILSGYPDGTFRPHATLTRAEASTAISLLRCRYLMEGQAAEMETEGWGEKEQLPLIDTTDFDPSAPEGTFMLRMKNLDKDMEEEKHHLKELLMMQFPAEGEDIYNAFARFTMMESGGSSLGICKQYVKGYPVLFNMIDGSFHIRILPKDYTDEYWETEPGQVNVYFI